MAPSFELRLESSDELLAVARRRKKSATSSYLISSGGSAGEVTRDDDELSGKVRQCCFLGSRVVLRTLTCWGCCRDPTCVSTAAFAMACQPLLRTQLPAWLELACHALDP
eukprot:GHRQ01032809.1.p2 GENE.GHRQ01032809.1~~GHRQ01032809.1.p2  ORF type:complete len:110 (-),score=25.82 GHRQ01032809.1:195-524(-)